MEIVLVLGYPAAGKTTYTRRLEASHDRVNRDAAGGSLDGLLPRVQAALGAGRPVVMDNTYATRESRQGVLALARTLAVPVRCLWLDTSIEDAQVNAVKRMVATHGRLLSPAEIKSVGKKDPGTYSPAALFRYRKIFEPPTPAEGFASVERVPFERAPDPAHWHDKALLLDYDGTLRRTVSGDKYPRTPDDVEILPNRRAVLAGYVAQGYRLLGVSNQGDVARGKLTEADARACFQRTNERLGLTVEVSFCPHDPAPIGCYCRKPMPGMGVAFMERYNLARAHTIMVGDMTTDRTFAQRVGIRYVDQAVFFG